MRPLPSGIWAVLYAAAASRSNSFGLGRREDGKKRLLGRSENSQERSRETFAIGIGAETQSCGGESAKISV